MTTFIPTNYYEMSFHHSLTGSLRPAVVTLGAHYTGNNFNQDAIETIDQWGFKILPVMCDVWHYNVGKLRDANGTVIERSTGFQGGKASPAATPNVTYLFKKLTGFGGRRFRGRMYLPGVAEGDMDAVGVLTAGKKTELNAAMQAFITAMESFNFIPSLLHEGTFGPTNIEQFVLQDLVATQRRRLRK